MIPNADYIPQSTNEVTLPLPGGLSTPVEDFLRKMEGWAKLDEIWIQDKWPSIVDQLPEWEATKILASLIKLG